MKSHLRSIIASMLLIGVNLYAVDSKTELKVAETIGAKATTEAMSKASVVSNQPNAQTDLTKVFNEDKNNKILFAFSKMSSVEIEKTKIINEVAMPEFGITKYVFSVEGYPQKGVMFITDKGLYLPTDFVSPDGINIFQTEFYKENKEWIDKQNTDKAKIELSEKDKFKANMIANAPKVAKFIADLEKDKNMTLVRTIPGNSTAKETLYLFTDPLCPYCKMYETGVHLKTGQAMPNSLQSDLAIYKEIKVIMYPLYMLPGHEEAIKRSYWFNIESKNVKTQKDILDLLHKASNADIKDLVVKDEAGLDKYDSYVKDKEKGLMSSGAVNGTPAMFTKDGIDPRIK